jgi:hypothetical protein
LGLAYLEDGKFAQADSEFDQCIKRRGEALSLFSDTQPAFGYFPHVYYQPRARPRSAETVGFAESVPAIPRDPRHTRARRTRCCAET